MLKYAHMKDGIKKAIEKTAFSQEVKERAMIACGRACSVCHKFCGVNMEVHHIEGGEGVFENAIPLCFDCHAEVGHYNNKHPKGVKYSPAELRHHRDNWCKKVAEAPAFSEAAEYMELDKATYGRLAAYLPYEKFVFLRDKSFDYARFPGGYFAEIERFCLDVSMNPHNEYMDFHLEKAKANLAESIEQFFEIALPVFSDSDKAGNDTIGIPYSPWCMEPNSEELRGAAVKKVDKAATAIWEKYCEYTQICRRKLKV